MPWFLSQPHANVPPGHGHDERAVADTEPAPLKAASPARALLLLTLAGLAARVLLLLLEPAVGPVADERTWTDWAKTVASERVHFSPFRTRMIFHPPLYPYFLAVPYALFGTLEAAKWVQAFFATLLVPAVGLVGFRVFGTRVGLVAAALCAFYPELVWFSVHFWVENVFLVLLFWAFERLLASDANGSRGAAVAAGLLWGLAILARETGLYFLPVAALWMVWRAAHREGALLRAALFAGTTLLTVAPWTYRNHVQFQALVPVSTAGGLNLFQGNARLTRQEVYDLYEAVQGRIEQYRFGQREGLRAIRERQPLWLAEKLYEQMPMFWEAESMAVIHVKRGAYGPVRPPVAVAVAVVMLAPYLAVLAFFVLGLARLGWDRRVLLLVAFLGYYNLIHVATHGFNRYRMPIMPIVFLLAASAFVAWRQGSLGLSPRRGAAAAALALAFGLILLPSFRVHWEHPAFALGHPGETAESP
jgi:4-amino-4-deoxy-L-arabinose transferase-like glycosyltransferase